jgi:hypothetical protein
VKGLEYAGLSLARMANFDISKMKKKVKVVGLKKEQMKASELDPNLFPRHQLVKAYESVGQEYEKTIQDRVYDVWYPLVTAEPVKDQEITQKITQLYRVKDAKGKEWLVYDIILYGQDWQGNTRSFDYREGIIEQMPEFDKKIDPATNAVISGTTQVHQTSKLYTIPFTKDKVNELSQYFTEPLSLIVKDKWTPRRYGCNSLQEFRDMEYDELISLKTGYTDYIKSKQQSSQQLGGR